MVLQGAEKRDSVGGVEHRRLDKVLKASFFQYLLPG